MNPAELRDQFALEAMKIILANPQHFRLQGKDPPDTEAKVAQMAYFMADAMMTRRG